MFPYFRKLDRLWYILAVIFICFAIFTTCIIVKYNHIKQENPAITCSPVSITPAKKIQMGTTVKANLKIIAPWNKRPSKVKVTSGKGSQIIGNPEIIHKKYNWGTSVWEIVCKIQPYSNGKIPDGNIKITFSSDTSERFETQNIKIPTLISEPIPDVKNLIMAGKQSELDNTTKTWIIIFSIITLCVLILIAYLILLKIRKKPLKPLTCWEVAIRKLQELRNNFEQGNITTEKCISTITDIIRNYLEARFNFHAPKQTTKEFLKNMENWDSPLNNKDRNALTEFMKSADMIKFAKYDASKDQVNMAFELSLNLVKNTEDKIQTRDQRPQTRD